jgi:hypothetical protein
MKNTTFKSIGAVLAGFVLAVVLSVLTDLILEKMGWLKIDPFAGNPTWLIAVLVVYRTIYNVSGCYLTARLAPNKPMVHVMVIGVLGLILSTVGAIVMWDVPPHWYPLTIAALSIPSAWLGAKLAAGKNRSETNS